MAKKTRRGLTGAKKFLLGIGIVFLLIALFFLSFWITTLSLRVNREPSVSTPDNAVVATSTPDVDYKKLSKKELIKLLEEKDEQIKELSEELGLGETITQAPIPSETPAPTETPEPSASASPTATATPKPTATPTPAAKTPTPTKAPATPTPKPTPAPTPTPKPSKAPIVPVAPAADSE